MKTTSQVTVITCDLCGKLRDEFEIEEIHADGTSYTSQICSHCILELKRQLSFFNITFWVKDGKGHFHSHADNAAFYVKGSARLGW